MNPGGSQTHPIERASSQSSAPTAVQTDAAELKGAMATGARESESGPREPPPPRASHPGDRIVPGDLIADRYEVLNVLGEGGMGIVFRCRDRYRNVEVALKQVTVPEGSLNLMATPPAPV